MNDDVINKSNDVIMQTFTMAAKKYGWKKVCVRFSKQ